MDGLPATLSRNLVRHSVYHRILKALGIVPVDVLTNLELILPGLQEFSFFSVLPIFNISDIVMRTLMLL